jgi:hypothetical protein
MKIQLESSFEVGHFTPREVEEPTQYCTGNDFKARMAKAPLVTCSTHTLYTIEFVFQFTVM